MSIFLRIELEGRDQWFESELPAGAPLPEKGGYVHLPGSGTPVFILERNLCLHPKTRVIESVIVKVRPPDLGPRTE